MPDAFNPTGRPPLYTPPFLPLPAYPKPILASIRGPRPATRLPLAGVAPLYLASPPHLFSCFNGGSRVAMVMRTGYRAPNRTQVVAAFTPPANLMFRIYRGLLHPLWAGASRSPPALRSVLLPLLPRFPPSVFSFDWFSRLFPAGLVLRVVVFSWSWNACGVVCFYLHTFSLTVCYL